MKQVVVGIISRIKNGEKQYFLISSTRDFGEYSGFYYPPGGHIGVNEDEKTALVREIREELDASVTPIDRVITTKGDIKDQITHWWTCETSEKFSPTIDTDEIENFGWFSKKEIINSDKVWPATKSFFKEYIS
jgi:8-oxo-dGTP pyrophosphatase MutT (NUDIX family)